MQKMRSVKQPWEIFTVAIDFSKNMEDDEAIIDSSSEVKVYEYGTGEDVTSEMITENIFVSDSVSLGCVLQGGEDGKDYKMSFRAYVSSTKKLEEDLKVLVRD